MAYYIPNGSGTVTRPKQLSTLSQIQTNWNNMKIQTSGIPTNVLGSEQVSSGFKVVGYDPTGSNTVIDAVPVITDISFSSSNNGRKATITFSDSQTKDVTVYYYRKCHYTKQEWTRSDTGIILTPDHGGGGSSYLYYQNDQVEGTQTDDASTSTTSSSTSCTVTTVPNFKTGNLSPQALSGTIKGIMDSTNGEMLTPAWLSDTDHYNSYNVSCISAINALIVINYTGKTECTYYWCHYAVNNYQPTN